MFSRYSKHETIECRSGRNAVLDSVKIDMTVEDLMAETIVEQCYRNSGDTNIEAVYTFPLPLDAILLSFDVTIGERKMVGQVFEKTVAEGSYESSIIAGDPAVMLEQVEPGIFSASVGNLLPNETAIIRFSYGMLLRWNGDKVRVSIPTTIAPRYGEPTNFEPHQVPIHSYAADHRFSVRIGVRGMLRDADFISPSHDVSVTGEPGKRVIKIDSDAPMDRDFVLEATQTESIPAGAITSRDIDGWVAIASFRPSIPTSSHTTPKCTKIVVDCSGSMGGDSIAQAKIALERILDSLRPGDFFDIVTFGSNWQALFNEATQITSGSLSKAREFVANIDADMGGTEIGGALDAAYQIAGPSELFRDLLLITDGEIWNSSEITASARSSGHRIFTVGVGSAVAEGFVRDLATVTGGACEMVAPLEDMADKIHRHFQRMYAPGAEQVTTHWPMKPDRQLSPSKATVFDGDTLHFLAWFSEKPEGSVRLTIDLPDGQSIVQSSAIQHWRYEDTNDTNGKKSTFLSTLSRIAAASTIDRCEDHAEVLKNALAYQLISEQTNYLVAYERDEDQKSGQLPYTIKVPQTIAAGWHGVGSTSAAPRLQRTDLASPKVSYDIEPRADLSDRIYDSIDEELASIASFDNDYTELESRLDSAIITVLDAEIRRQLSLSRTYLAPSIEELEKWGLPVEICSKLRGIISEEWAENAVVIAFFKALSLPGNRKMFSRGVRRWIKHQSRALNVTESLIIEILVQFDSDLAEVI